MILSPLREKRIRCNSFYQATITLILKPSKNVKPDTLLVEIQNNTMTLQNSLTFFKNV